MMPRYTGDLVSGNKGKHTYAEVVGSRKAVKTQESGPVVPPVSILDCDSGVVLKAEIPQSIPKILAESKIRQPLRFFPNQNPPSQQKLGKGLSIHISEHGKRRVTWTSQAEHEDETHARVISREKWVPKNQVKQTGPVGNTLLVGSTDRPTFEIGGPSGHREDGSEADPSGPTGLVLNGPMVTNVVVGIDAGPAGPAGPISNNHQAESLLPNQGEPKPEEFNPRRMALTPVANAGQAVTQLEHARNELEAHREWTFQLADGRRLALPDFFPPLWSWRGVAHPRAVPESFEPTPMGVNGFSNGGFMGKTPESAGFQLELTGLEMVEVQMPDPMVIRPISMVCPLLEATSMPEIPEIGFYQNPPSEWVLGQMKSFGESVGASYEGYEEEVISLLQKIELRRPQPRARAPSQHRGSQSSSKGLRELWGLVSSVNYDSKITDSHRNTRERVMMLSL